jgi:UDP-N-acetylmuramyl pentapeptide phosphotransferase/UDP-N-acetylglucosamine-1-phosphate transferase
MGGLGFFPAILIFVLMIHNEIDMLLVGGSLLVIMVVGAIDDLKDISPYIRLGVQALVGVAVVKAGLVPSIGLPESIEVFVPIFTVFLVMGVVNAYNMIDGIDGLAGGVALVNILAFSVISAYGNSIDLLILNLLLLGAIVGFLIFNINPAKIFMGDTGSLALGLLSVVMAVYSWNIEVQEIKLIALASLLFPSLDMCRLILARLSKKRSPFSADKNHLHHLLLVSTSRHSRAAGLCTAAHGSNLLFAWWIGASADLILAIPLLVLYGLFTYVWVAKMLSNKASHDAEKYDDLMKKRLLENQFLKNSV